jgi:hypothetical protein
MCADWLSGCVAAVRVCHVQQRVLRQLPHHEPSEGRRCAIFISPSTSQYSRARAAAQVGQPTDEEAWGMYPQQVRACVRALNSVMGHTGIVCFTDQCVLRSGTESDGFSCRFAFTPILLDSYNTCQPSCVDHSSTQTRQVHACSLALDYAASRVTRQARSTTVALAV